MCKPLTASDELAVDFETSPHAARPERMRAGRGRRGGRGLLGPEPSRGRHERKLTLPDDHALRAARHVCDVPAAHHE